MIHAPTILPLSWLRHQGGFYARVITIVPRYVEGAPAHAYEWLINGCTEEQWSGIPLTPELLLASGGGWKLRNENEYLISYASQNESRVAWMKEPAGGPYEKGEIVFYPTDRTIHFVHDLHLQYFAACGKPLIFNL